MPVGIQVFNDAGTVQIDSTWRNYSLVSVTTLTSSNNAWGETNYAGVIFQTSNAADLVFCYCTSQFFPVCFVQQNGQRAYRVGTGAATGVAVTFYVFRQQTPTSAGFGLQVYNEAGQLTFDSSNQICRIVGSLPITLSSPTEFFFFGAGGRYAVMISSFTGQLIQQDTGAGQGGLAFRMLSTNSPRLQCQDSGVTYSGLAISSLKQIPIQNPSPGVIIRDFNGAPYIVTDVRGYS